MTPKGKKMLIITSLILVIGGVVGYVIYKKRKDKEAEAKILEEQGTLADGEVKVTTTNPVTVSGALTLEETKAFQDWLDIKYPKWYKNGTLNKGGGYGTFGPATSKAFVSYGAEWRKLTTTDPLNPKGYDKGYVDSWNVAKKSGAKTFVWLGVTYSTATGRVSIEGDNAMGKFARPKQVPGFAKIRSNTLTIDTGPSATLLGTINYPNYIGVIKNTTWGKDKSGKNYRWYELNLKTPLVAQPGSAGQYAKTGWVREDAIDILKSV